MKLHLTNTQGLNLFTAHGDGYVAVNGQRHEQPLIVLPGRVQPWSATSFDALAAADFAAIADLRPDLVLLGTGVRGRFPPARLTAPLLAAGLGLEVMDTAAACRTYNILAGEGRNVAAALLLDA